MVSLSGIIPSTLPGTLSIEVDNTLHIPLRTFGTKIAFRTRVPSEAELRNCEHVHMTSASIWNPNDIVMIQATAQSASPWKRRVASINTFTKQHEYVDATCDDALLDSVDPSLVPVMTSLHKRRRIAQADAEYEPMDMPAKTHLCEQRTTFEGDSGNWWQSDLVSALCERNAHFRVTTQMWSLIPRFFPSVDNTEQSECLASNGYTASSPLTQHMVR
jgi:hypothetical protein